MDDDDDGLVRLGILRRDCRGTSTVKYCERALCICEDDIVAASDGARLWPREGAAIDFREAADISGRVPQLCNSVGREAS